MSGSFGGRPGQSWVSPHFFRQHRLEKNAGLTPTPAVTDRMRAKIVFLCANRNRKLVCGGFVRWCNGSTRPFGGLCPGANPGRTAKLKSEIRGPTSERILDAQG